MAPVQMDEQQEKSEVVEQILRCDVLHGRGKSVHHHVGNIQYRSLVKAMACDYQQLTGIEKDDIARRVIQIIEDRGGRFLRPVGDGSQWVKCLYHVVRTKVKQALRDIVKTKSPRKNSSSKTPPNPSPAPQQLVDVEQCTEEGTKERTSSETAHRTPERLPAMNSDMLQHRVSANPSSTPRPQSFQFQSVGSSLHGMGPATVAPNVVMPQLQHLSRLSSPNQPLPSSSFALGVNVAAASRFGETANDTILLQSHMLHQRQQFNALLPIGDRELLELLRRLHAPPRHQQWR